MIEVLREAELINALRRIQCGFEGWEQDEQAVIASFKALQRLVEWTKERPTKKGWYWMRYASDDSAPDVFYINEHMDILLGADEWDSFEGLYLKHPQCEWCYIEAPHEARG